MYIGPMGRIKSLGATFRSRDGSPALARVDTGIFRYRYFTHCLQCTFCHDQCCEDGVDVDFTHVEAIERHAVELEAYTGVPRGEWFTDEVDRDPGYPGGGARRTATRNGGCVFLTPGGRGCRLHAFCLERGIDYHALKSPVDCLFPLTWYDDVLCAADEVEDGELICTGTGPTLYRGIRHEVAYYFGDGCVVALDRIEADISAAT